MSGVYAPRDHQGPFRRACYHCGSPNRTLPLAAHPRGISRARVWEGGDCGRYWMTA